MKKFVGIIVATVLAFSLVGCGPVDSAIQNIASSGSNTSSKSGVVTADDDGYAEGRMGDVMRTYFFDYTVNSAYTCNDYEGYTPSEGNKLLVAEITVKNTDRSTVTMYDTDFQIQWGEGANDYGTCLNAVDDTMMPYAYELTPGQERSDWLMAEIPDGSTSCTIAYQEYKTDGSKGDAYFVEAAL